MKILSVGLNATDLAMMDVAMVIVTWPETKATTAALDTEDQVIPHHDDMTWWPQTKYREELGYGQGWVGAQETHYSRSQSPWQPLLGLLPWCPIFKSRQCNSFEDWTPVNSIY